MNRQEKEQVIQTLKQDFEKSEASFLVSYKGMNVKQVFNLRKQLRQKGGSFKVAKVTLIKRVANEVPSIEQLSPFLKDQVGIVFASQESPAIAKILYDFTKENKQLAVLAGCLDSELLSKESIKVLANLPSREVLLSQVGGMLKSPISRTGLALTTLLVKFVLMLKKIEEKKASESPVVEQQAEQTNVEPVEQ